MQTKKGAMIMQGYYLNELRVKQIPATVFLVNGFRFHGMIKGFDNFTVVLQVDQKQQVIYKHAISTILPDQPVVLEVK